MKIIEVTDEEINILRELLHRAALHSGLQVVDAVAHWNRKLVEAMGPAPKLNGAARPPQKELTQ